MSEITLDTMIACAAREWALRKNVYPKWIANGRMTQVKADDEIANMEAIIEALKDLRTYKDMTAKSLKEHMKGITL